MRDCSSPKKCISAYSAHIYEENTPSLVSPCITSDGGTQMHGLLRRRETCDIKKLVRSSCSEREFSRLKRGRLRTFAQHSETVNIACPLRHAQQFKFPVTICADVPLYFSTAAAMASNLPLLSVCLRYIHLANGRESRRGLSLSSGKLSPCILPMLREGEYHTGQGVKPIAHINKFINRYGCVSETRVVEAPYTWYLSE